MYDCSCSALSKSSAERPSMLSHDFPLEVLEMAVDFEPLLVAVLEAWQLTLTTLSISAASE